MPDHINPFEHTNPNALFAKIITFKDQAGFLNEPPVKLVHYNKRTDTFVTDPDSGQLNPAVYIQDFEIEQNNKTYVCRTFIVDYSSMKEGCYVPYDNSSTRSFRTLDVLVIGPQDLALDTHEFSIIGGFEGHVDSSFTLEIYDLDTKNKSVVLSKKKEVVNGTIAKDVNKIPDSFFFKDRETFTIKIGVSAPGRLPLSFCTRLNYLSYNDVGLN